jgi:uroporphyrinogen-III synthase
MSLSDRTILVTRPKDAAAEMVREIERRGGAAVVIPMITITPPASWKDCDDAIAGIRQYDAIVFASVNAVESFAGRARVLGVDPGSFEGIATMAVGEKTAEAIRKIGLTVALVPETSSGASLAAAMGLSCAGKRVLVPRGSLAREDLVSGLRETGAHVDAVTVYATETPQGLSAASIARRVLAGEFDIVTFASPSAAVHFANLFSPAELHELPECAKIAAIGPSTADAVRALGLSIDVVAREATAANLVQCIDEYYG